MSRGTTYRSSEVEFNGKALMCVNSGAVAVNGTVEPAGGRWAAPFDGTIRVVQVTITTMFTHASAALRIGSQTTPDDLLNDYVLQNIAVGTYDLAYDTLMVSRTISKGTAYTVGIVCGDTTGELDFTIVIEPR